MKKSKTYLNKFWRILKLKVLLKITIIQKMH